MGAGLRVAGGGSGEPVLLLLHGLGATGDGAHALHEHVKVAELPERAAIIAGLLFRLTRG